MERPHMRWPVSPLRWISEFGASIAVVSLVVACSSSAASVAPFLTPTVAPSNSTSTIAPTPAITASPTPPEPVPTVNVVVITPIPDAPDSGILVELTARAVRWSISLIDAPAGEVWHVTIDDQDPDRQVGLQHNFTVASGPSFPERIFQSPNFGFGIHSFDIPALPAGSYLFICTVHPEIMTGTLTIR